MSQLINALLDKKLINAEQLQDARNKQLGAKKPLHELLVEMGFLKEEALIKVASDVFKLPIIHIENETIDVSVLELLPYDRAKLYGAFPLRKEKGEILIAMVDPQDVIALDDLQIITGMKVKPVLSTKSDISRYIEKYYHADESIYNLMKNIVDDTKVSLVEAGKSNQDWSGLESLKGQVSPVIRMVDLIIIEAVKSRASDIHIEPFADFVEVRYRIDGFLKSVMKLPKKLFNPLSSRIKILSGLDITEKLKSQDGRSKIMINENQIDLRISIIPAFYGEKIVIRVLDARYTRVSLESIGFQQDEFAIFKEAIKKPQGMILVTGPTSSGKTSTIYAALNEINDESINIITIEDPVEYKIEGVNQIQINPFKDVTFSSGLRSILRQDPNVILVGEIRDKDTADIAFRASLTGHLVFSTLHTNNAIASITRLKDIGLDAYIISSSLIFVLAQRLVRVICPHCKEPYNPSADLIDNYRVLINKLKIKQFFKGAGCQKCNYVGFLGRTAIFEILRVNDQIKELILKDSSEKVIFEAAASHGFKNLVESGVIKVSQGITTLEEVKRVSDDQENESIEAKRSDKEVTILVVDDEDDLRKIISKRLAYAGYKVIGARDGQEAIELVFKEKPDLVIMDIMMPNIDGIEATKKLRSNLETASLPIIMLTAKKDPKSELQGIDAGADDYIVKPFDGDKLLARVKMLLRRV